MAKQVSEYKYSLKKLAENSKEEKIKQKLAKIVASLKREQNSLKVHKINYYITTGFISKLVFHF